VTQLAGIDGEREWIAATSVEDPGDETLATQATGRA
jgi:hypothetical protein